MFRNKIGLNKFKKIEITSSIFSDQNAMRLEISYRKKAGKVTNMWRLHNMLLNNQRIIEEIKEEIQYNPHEISLFLCLTDEEAEAQRWLSNLLKITQLASGGVRI